MSSADKNLNLHDKRNLSSIEDMCVGVIISEWNNEVTDKLRDACIDALYAHGLKDQNLTLKYVPGSYELSLELKRLPQTLKLTR